jgi:hypothetical protein
MAQSPKIPWPTTYLGRLHSVTSEMRNLGDSASAESIAGRFDDTTVEQVEAILAALILFGRVEKKGEFFMVIDGAV